MKYTYYSWKMLVIRIPDDVSYLAIPCSIMYHEWWMVAGISIEIMEDSYD